jgi:hypothetical protein
MQTEKKQEKHNITLHNLFNIDHLFRGIMEIIGIFVRRHDKSLSDIHQHYKNFGILRTTTGNSV